MGLLARHGHIPLPPYIASKREDDGRDRRDYQTLFAKHEGSVAAPTAGLHFDAPLIEALRSAGVQTAFLTLHVGAGTFQPVRTSQVEDHRMHAEYIDVGEDLCASVMSAHAEGRRVIAVGTTSLRGLEAAPQSPTDGEPGVAGRGVPAPGIAWRLRQTGFRPALESRRATDQCSTPGASASTRVLLSGATTRPNTTSGRAYKPCALHSDSWSSAGSSSGFMAGLGQVICLLIGPGRADAFDRESVSCPGGSVYPTEGGGA